MLSITREQAHRLLKQSERAKQMVKRTKDAAHATVRTAVDAVEVGGAAFAMGVIQGRMGGVEIVGMPLDLVAALGCHAMAFVLDGEYADHLHNFGNGALAMYLGTMGASVGHDMAVKAGKTPGTAAALPSTTHAGFHGMTTEELVALAQTA